MLSQYTDPELVAGGLSAGIVGANLNTPKSIDNIFSNPKMLRSLTPDLVKDMASTKNAQWSLGTLLIFGNNLV